MNAAPEIELVPSEKEHADILAVISERAYNHAAAEHGKTPWGPRGYKSAKDQLYYIEKLETYSILYDDIIIGGLVVSDNGFGVKEVVRLFVDPDFQRTGIASKTLDLLINISEAKAWTVGTVKWNTINQRFLEHNEFKRIGEIKGDEPHIWYQKTLENLSLPTISQLSSEMNRIVVEGEIVEKAPSREVRGRRRGRRLLVTEATLQDSTDDVVLVLWNEQIKQCIVGSRVRVEGGYVKDYQGIRQLNVGKTGKLITLD